jgi:hypothetical protein
MIKLILKILALVIVLSSFIVVCVKAGIELQDKNLESNIVLTSFNHINQPTKGNSFAINLSLKETSFINDVDLYIEGKKISSSKNLICKNNRYYFAVSDFEKIYNYKIKITNNTLFVYTEGSKNADSDSSYYTDRTLIHPYLEYDNTAYLSMIDMTESLNLTVFWDYDKKTLSFYKVREELSRETRQHSKRPALIRLEDVTAGAIYTNSDSLEKLRIMSDYMYSKDVPFHIAWVPRYMNPEKGIDNNLLEVYSLSNVDFIYTMDYMISKGGIVGLHGYTHQYGGEESIVGAEFGDKACFNLNETKSRIEASIATAKTLDIPYEFFESPHYRSTKEQEQAVFENYFNYMFEPSKALFNNKPALGKGNNKTIYVPAPLGYIHDNDIDDMIKRIKTKPRDHIAAMFYHPSKEFQFIAITNRQGYHKYEYSQDSILHKLLNCLKEERYTPVRITDVRLEKKSHRAF